MFWREKIQIKSRNRSNRVVLVGWDNFQSHFLLHSRRQLRLAQRSAWWSGWGFLSVSRPMWLWRAPTLGTQNLYDVLLSGWIRMFSKELQSLCLTSYWTLTIQVIFGGAPVVLCALPTLPIPWVLVNGSYRDFERFLSVVASTVRDGVPIF